MVAEQSPSPSFHLPPPLPRTLAAYDMPPYQPLRLRGLSGARLAIFGIRRSGRYWVYPVHDGHEAVAWRGKAAVSGVAKYRWMTEYGPSRPDVLYNAVSVPAGRTAFLVGGEPDVWLMGELGLYACCLLCGEGCAAEAPLGELASLQPARVVVIYDNDETGRKGAVKAVRMLRASGMPAMALDLAGHVPDKGDITDLYAMCGRDRARFVAALRALPKLAIPALPEPTRLAERKRTYSGTGASRIESFKQQFPIEQLVGDVVPLAPYQDGKFMKGVCPFHDDHSPSFWVNVEKGTFGCWGCEARGDALDFMALWSKKAEAHSWRA